MWYIFVLFFILLGISIFVLEFEKRTKTSVSTYSPYYAYALFGFSVLFLSLLSIETIKNNIINNYFDKSPDNIFCLLFSFIFVIYIIFFIFGFVIRYKKVKAITTEILERFHCIYKAGASDYQTRMFAIIDNLLGYGFYSIIKGLDKWIRGISDGYVFYKYTELNIKIKENNIEDLICQYTQHWLKPSGENNSMTEDEYIVFEYCEKKLYTNKNIKTIVPMEVFSLHKSLSKNELTDDWREYETNLLEELLTWYHLYEKFETFELLINAKENLCRKLHYQHAQEEQAAYIDKLIDFIKQNRC